MLSEEIRNADQRILMREFFRSNRVALQVLFLGFVWLIALNSHQFITGMFWTALGLLVHYGFAQAAAKRKRFISPRFSSLWNGCRERFESFEEGIQKLKKAEIAQFQELPETVRELALTMYNALRRADLLFDEVTKSEGVDRVRPGVPLFKPTDPQAQELYRIAEKNLGEYRSNYNELMAGIQRTEAQATVFMTTIDNLRVKMLGYRLIGKNPSMNSEEFLSALAEARAQLSAIDQALDELDLSHYPKTVAVIPSSEEDLHMTEPPSYPVQNEQVHEEERF